MGLAIISLLILLAAMGMALRERNNTYIAKEEARALRLAQSIALLTESAGLKDPVAVNKLIKELGERGVQQMAGGVQAVAVLLEGMKAKFSFMKSRSMRYLAHSDQKRKDLSFNTKRVRDRKALERHNAAKSAWTDTTTGPKGAKKPRKIKHQVKWVMTPAVGERVVAVTVPLLKDGKFAGSVLLDMSARPVTTGLPWWWIMGITLGAVLLAMALGYYFRRRRGLIAAIVLLASAGGALTVNLVWGRDMAEQAALQNNREQKFTVQMLQAHSGKKISMPLERAPLLHPQKARASSTLLWLLPLLMGFLAFGLTIALYRNVFGRARQAFRENFFAYAYTAPAMSGMLLLVFIPFAFGIILGFFRHDHGAYNFVGFDNFVDILFTTETSNFYFTLGVTVMWTAFNVFLHVSIGLGLALILKDPLLKLKSIYRILLIVPWAIPNYITALIWKSMFNEQFGTINYIFGAFGVDKVDWFGSFWTSFTANVTTNTWLGFPFMMVVSLGALQSIPQDLYEAADIDGASRWKKFTKITLPLLKPALFPAVILGSIWTFNMFNIIYLVSAGQPDTETNILITEAFYWFKERDRYGYAAAYSTIIFLVLFIYTLVANRLTKATKGAFE